MKVEILYVADCPSAPAIMRRAKELAHARDDLTLTLVEVTDDRPVPVGFAGSPTILVNGVNPFSGTPVEAAACALHPPSVAQLEQALIAD